MKYTSLVLGIIFMVTGALVQASDTHVGCVTATVSYSRDKIVFEKIEVKGEEYDRIIGGSALDFGEPCLPNKMIRMAIPPEMAITKIEILQAEPETLAGSFYLFPQQPPRIPIIPPEPPPEFVPPDSQVYNSSKPYPGEFVRLGGEGYVYCGQRMAFLWVYPLQYIPKERMLIFYPTIEFRAYYSPGGEPRNPADLPLTERERKECEEKLKRVVINPEDVDIPLRPRLEGSKNLPPDTNEYVIITRSALKNSFNELLYWKKRKGFEIL